MADRADFPCPTCDSSDVFASGEDGLYECRDCGQRTHEKIARNADLLRDVADSELEGSELAEVLLGR